MLKKLKDLKEKFEASNGWSAQAFYGIYQTIKDKLVENGVTLTVGRTVMYLKKDDITIKLYVHYQGAPKTQLTITDDKNNIVETIQSNSKPLEILNTLLTAFTKIKETTKK